MRSSLRRRTVSLAVAASLGVAVFWPALARGDEEVDLKRPEAGVGVGFRPPALQLGEGLSSTGTDLLVPFRLGALRLEPSLGLSTSKTESALSKASNTTVEGGVGLFYGWALDHRTAAYVGSRFGIGRSSASVTQTNPPGTDFTSHQNNWFIAPGAGAEVYLSPSFSLGAEVALAYARRSKPDVSPDSGLGALSGTKGWSLFTRTTVLFRVYFWRLD